MSNDSLIDKADSLMSRVGHPSSPAVDAEIPMLSELITPGATKDQAPNVIDEHTKQLIIKAALSQLVPLIEEKIARDLQQRLVSHLNSAASAAVTVAVADLRLELSNAVGDAVNRAVRDVLKV